MLSSTKDIIIKTQILDDILIIREVKSTIADSNQFRGLMRIYNIPYKEYRLVLVKCNLGGSWYEFNCANSYWNNLETKDIHSAIRICRELNKRSNE